MHEDEDGMVEILVWEDLPAIGRQGPAKSGRRVPACIHHIHGNPIVGRCRRPAIARGLCAAHWRAWQLGITLASDQVGTPSGFGLLGIVTRGPDFVICHECGRSFKNLGSHIAGTHQMTTHAYRDRHQLAANDALMCDDLRTKIAGESKERIGSAAWQRFEDARDAEGAHEQLVALAAAAKPRTGARARIGAGPKKLVARGCGVCGKPLPPGTGSRGRQTCSEECWHESKVRAAGKREAQRLGEPKNFTRRGAPVLGVHMRLEDYARWLAITPGGLRRRIKAGKTRPHDGRKNWVAFWIVSLS